ncbi:MAG: hypothetical protein IPM29_05670 [Planctomycetes bacterium]|nr:hypothetical protein [Planctomycetota bacterium]
MLNAPRPAFAGTRQEYRDGVEAMTRMLCATCHVPDWHIEGARGPGHRDDPDPDGPEDGRRADHPGDRRFFDLDVSWNERAGRLEGHLVPLFDRRGPRYERRFDAFRVEGLFTDFRHHDMGADFEELDFGGTLNRLWRTAPLWGVGSGFPWGHDGRSLTLEDAILRHGGEAAASRAAWLAARPRDREAVMNLLRKLVLFDIESLPTDVDGDGRIAEHFTVAGADTGPERFNPEWLFRVPAHIQGPFVNSDGVTVRSFAVTNIDDAYGQTLRLRVDTDKDGWPDWWDRAPTTRGYHDGVR